MAKLKTMALILLGAAAGGLASSKARARLRLSRAKHRSLAGHVRMGKRIAALMPRYAFDANDFFRADDPPELVEAKRRAGFNRLSNLYSRRFALTAARTAEIRDAVPDIEFTSAYRVPFQFSPVVRERLPMGNFLASSEGVMLTDLDGNSFYDLTGSYGVNLLGNDAYRRLKIGRAHV